MSFNCCSTFSKAPEAGTEPKAKAGWQICVSCESSGEAKGSCSGLRKTLKDTVLLRGSSPSQLSLSIRTWISLLSRPPNSLNVSFAFASGYPGYPGLETSDTLPCSARLQSIPSLLAYGCSECSGQMCPMHPALFRQAIQQAQNQARAKAGGASWISSKFCTQAVKGLTRVRS